MTFNEIATFATAIFTILNPIGNTALFAGMVTKLSRASRLEKSAKRSMAR